MSNEPVSEPQTAQQQTGLELVRYQDDDYARYLDQLPDKKRLRIIAKNQVMQHGLHSTAPMICCGPNKCKVIEWCPIPEMSDSGEKILGPAANYPIGQPCIMERLYIASRAAELSAYLKVDPGNPIEATIVDELALIDLYKHRCQMFLAKGDRDGQGLDFMRIDTMGYDEYGNEKTKAAIHPIAEMMDKLERRRERWLDRLNETRKAKQEIAMKAGSSAPESKVLREMEQLRKGIADLILSTVDDAIEIEQIKLGD